MVDWRTVIAVAIRFIPGFKEAANWMTAHSQGYEVRVVGDKVIIEVDLDTPENAGLMARYLDSFMSTIIVNRRRVFRVIK